MGHQYMLRMSRKPVSVLVEKSNKTIMFQIQFMTGTDFQTIVREKDYCKIQIMLNLCLIKFSVPEPFETYRFLRQQIIITTTTSHLNSLTQQISYDSGNHFFQVNLEHVPLHCPRKQNYDLLP
jgi:hypothetical protein